MFCFINIYLYSKVDKEEELIYFNSDFRPIEWHLTEMVWSTPFSLFTAVLGKIKFYFLPLTEVCPLTFVERTHVRNKFIQIYLFK